MGTQRHSGFNLEELEAAQADLITGSNFIGVANIHKNYVGTGAGAETQFGASTDEQIMVYVPSMQFADLASYESIVCEAYFEIKGSANKKYIWLQDGGQALLVANAIAEVNDGSTSEFAAGWDGVVRVKFTLQKQGGSNLFVWDTQVEDPGVTKFGLSTGVIAHDPTSDADALMLCGKCDDVADSVLPLHSEYHLVKKSV